jgi:hypothetical protein
MAAWCPGIPPYLGQFGAGGERLRDTEAVRAGKGLGKPAIRDMSLCPGGLLGRPPPVHMDDLSLAQHCPAFAPDIALRVRSVALGPVPVTVVLVAAHGRQHDGVRGWQEEPVQYGQGQPAGPEEPLDVVEPHHVVAGRIEARQQACQRFPGRRHDKTEAAEHQPHRLERCPGLPGRGLPD